jgi:PIN domain nuclease of toxin-antitoxin system
VNLLIDTHALLWWLGDDPLDRGAAAAIADPRNEAYISAASIWETSIKVAAGKLEIKGSLLDSVERSHLTALAITLAHAQRAGELPPHHRDPFDRMLVAQAQLEGLTVVTRDPIFASYGVPVLPC